MENITEALEKEKQAAQKRNSQKPVIDHLSDIVSVNDDGTVSFTAKKGDRIVIERWIQIKNMKPTWLDTKIYELKDVDHETGNLFLWDPEMQHNACSNYISGTLKYGYHFKMMSAKGRLKKASTQPKVVVDASVDKKKKNLKVKDGSRRVYATRGIIHTRVSGQAYGPTSETRVESGVRINASLVGNELIVKALDGSWSETWKAIDV